MSEPFQSKTQAKDGVFWRLYSPRRFSNPFAAREPQYDRLADGVSEGQLGEKPQPAWLRRTSGRLFPFLIILSYILVAVLSFGAGFLHRASETRHESNPSLAGVASRVPLPLIKKKFVEKSDFLKEPPHGEGSGNVSEPIWDELLPNGLGYFKDGDLAPVASIPTVFHELHCLYILRRAYYQESDGLEAFDFGKERSAHVAHCFDYLRQGLTCNVDTTIEPAVGEYGAFLGNGFDRQCQDFEALKDYVAEYRVFDASGFLAAGLDHGHAHVKQDG